MKFWQYYCIIGDLAVSKVSKEPAFVQKHSLITRSMAVSFIIIIQHIIFINYDHTLQLHFWQEQVTYVRDNYAKIS